jgi:hypothetical protein
MGHLAWRKESIARIQPEPFLPYLNDELAFKDVEPLILVEMQVPRRPSLGMKGVLDNKDVTAILWCHLEIDRTNSKASLFAKAVCTGGDPPYWRNSHLM